MCDIKAILGNTGREAQQLGPRESAKGKTTRRNRPWKVQWGRVVGSKHRAWLCSQGLLEDQAVGPAVAKRSTELSVLVFLLNRSISVLQDVPQRGMAVHGWGRRVSAAKS